MKKVPTVSSDYLVSKNTPLTVVANIFIRNGTYLFTFRGWVYNTMFTSISFYSYLPL